jgi:hypothetical protein
MINWAKLREVNLPIYPRKKDQAILEFYNPTLVTGTIEFNCGSRYAILNFFNPQEIGCVKIADN